MQEMERAVSSTSGGHNRTFTAAEEEELREQLLASPNAPTIRHVQATALAYRTQLNAAKGKHHLRSSGRPFSASNGWACGFLPRNSFSSHRTKLIGGKPPAGPPRDIEGESLDFVTRVRDAVLRLRPKLVLNMDETPVQLCDYSPTGYTRRGSGHPAPILTSTSCRSYLTTFPTISAAGNRLRMCAVLKGRTRRCLLKVQRGASLEAKRVKLYYTERGKMNIVTMLAWLQDVVHSYTQHRPAALVLDSYGSHIAPDVLDLASSLNIEIIQVPPGLTSTLQPLDVCFNGPMLAHRRRIHSVQRMLNPFRPDDWQRAVERAQQSYQSMSNDATRSAWRAAYIID